MKRIAVIGAILEKPHLTQKAFNETVAEFKGIVRGRMGIPFDEEDMSVISLTVLAELDEINSLTGKLGKIDHITVKTAISKEKGKD